MFLTVFEAISLNSMAQHNKVSKDDNYNIWKLMYELNRAIVIKNVAPEDTLNIEKINQAVSVSKISYQSGGICYSPDKSFSIISAEGSDCSTNSCNCLNHSRLYFTNTGKSIQAKPIDMCPDFLYADTIFKLGGNKYLVLQSSDGCNGTASVSYKRATLFSIIKNKITYYPINDDSDTTENSDHGLALFQYDNDGLSKYPFILKFDTDNKRLIYGYVLDTDTSLNPNAENYITGYYEYRDGSFYSNQSTAQKLGKH